MMLTLLPLRSLFVAAAIFGIATATASHAADPDIASLRTPGSYVVLLDGQGKPLSGAYWLSANIKMVMHSEDTSAGSFPIYVDRELFPHYVAVFPYFINERLGYDPDPMELDVGKGGDITATAVPVGLSTPGTIRQQTFAYSVESKSTSVLQNVKLVTRFYSIKEEGVAIPGRNAGARAYIETLDIDLPANAVARAASIETGRALSSGDFEAVYFQKSALTPDLVKCIEKARASEAFQTAARKQRDTADLWMATKLPLEGMAYWQRKDAAAADFDPDITQICG